MQVIGWENIELISDRPLDVMLDDFARLKAEFPDRQSFHLDQPALKTPRLKVVSLNASTARIASI